jgi:steroid delta-isomerase
MPTPAERTIANYFATTRNGDRQGWVGCFSKTGSTEDPAGTPPHVGHEALGKFFDSIVGLVETIGLHEDHVFTCGSQVAVKWTGRGLSKTGKPYTFEGVDVFECDEAGRIVKLKAYWDPAKLMAQLG